MTITDRDHLRPVAVFRKLEYAIRRAYPKDFIWRFDEAKRMVGTAEFQRQLERGADPLLIQQLFDQGPTIFGKSRQTYLLY